MDDIALARLCHVVAIIGWIGGVWFVTLVELPVIERNTLDWKRREAFQRIEATFAPQARLWMLLAGASGLWMVWRGHMWARFRDQHYWWMHAMLWLWVLFFLILFVIEPLFLRRRIATSRRQEADFDRLVVMHRVLSIAGFITIVGTVAGVHGMI
jgi:uncharacterized membrane protein